jgi:hypothetical protein
MFDRCSNCEQGRCCHGGGTVSVIDQDGYSTYVCKCFCAVVARQKRDDDLEIQQFVKKYGKARIRKALDH